jgi:hypothetical protein
MKKLIRQILREETSGLNPTIIKAFYHFMDMELKGYEVYIDTPENRFKFSPESIWVINPKTKKYFIEVKKSGNIWYNNEFYKNFSKYFTSKSSIYGKLINIWVEDVLKIKNPLTLGPTWIQHEMLDDILNKGIKLQ